MILSSQYYRPPFPETHRWKSDLHDMRAAGLTHVYLWATWGWIEQRPGESRYDDYDRLFDLAGEAGLKVVVNTLAEIQPSWVGREFPGAEMIDHTGRRVTSSTLVYSNAGVMPGACLDHPDVARLSARFLEDFAARYAGVPHLAAWDCWNELRWSSHSDGYVCYCDRTVAAFRSWLDDRHGGLDGLARAWRRRIATWEDVEPGRVHGRSYTELTAFQEFLTARVAGLVRDRYAAIRRGDPDRPIAAHTAFPATYFTGTGFLPFERALGRGNDWDTSEIVDAFGSSQFPTWFSMAPSEFGARVESGRSAAAEVGKPYWVAELQGGAHRHGIEVTEPLSGRRQHRWVWTGYARGAKLVNFWCWRDEIFGREASGFGITGDDGHAADRLAELARTGDVLRRWNDLLDGYAPEEGHVGVVFSQANYQLDWAQSGPDAASAGPSTQGWLYALERSQTPYRVVEANRSGRLDGLAVLVVPWAMIVDEPLAAALDGWVREGGTLLLETEAGAYDAHAIYRYPDERPFPGSLGITGSGRRVIGDRTVDVASEDGTLRLRPASWLEYYDGADLDVLGRAGDDPVVVSRRVGRGRVVAIGTHAGLAYERERYTDFERFLSGVLRDAGVTSSWRCSVPDGDVVQWRFGHSGPTPLLFVTNAGPAATVTFTTGTAGPFDAAEDLAGGETLRFGESGGRRTLTIALDEDDWRVFRLT